MAKLNAAKLRTLSKPGTYGDGAGLYLQVRGAERRSWLYRFKLRGKPHLTHVIHRTKWLPRYHGIVTYRHAPPHRLAGPHFKPYL